MIIVEMLFGKQKTWATVQMVVLIACQYATRVRGVLKTHFFAPKGVKKQVLKKVLIKFISIYDQKNIKNNKKVGEILKGTIPEFEIASRDLEEFKEQVERADVLYVRGGSSDLLFEIMKSFEKDEFFDLIQGKVCAGSSAGVMVLSEFSRSDTTGFWKEGLGVLPIVSFVHWSLDFQKDLDEFKKEKGDENLEYVLIPETEFVIREV